LHAESGGANQTKVETATPDTLAAVDARP